MLRPTAPLPRQRQALPAQTAVSRPETLAQGIQSLQRVVSAIVQPVAITPFIVAGHENEGQGGVVEKRQSVIEQRIVTAILAVLDIADMDDQCVAAGGNVFQHQWQFGALKAGVGRVANQCKTPDLGMGRGAAQPEASCGEHRFLPKFQVHRR